MDTVFFIIIMFVFIYKCAVADHIAFRVIYLILIMIFIVGIIGTLID